MISLVLDEQTAGFENDIREMTQAFYPGETFDVRTPDGREIQNGRPVEADAQKAGRRGRRSSPAPVQTDGRELAAFGGIRVLACAGQTDEGAEEGRDGAAVAETPRLQIRMDSAALGLTGRHKTDKGQIKTALYRLLSALTGRELPWGTLTGIRPVKLAEELLRAFDPSVTARLLQRDYLVSGEKLELMLDIAQREQRLLDSIRQKTGSPYQEGWSLYIGIPFCPTRCLYCSFTSNPIEQWNGELGAYLDALAHELKLTAECLRGKPLQTIYIGGGTPTALPEPWLARLMELVHAQFDVGAAAEFTVEAGRPDSITREKLAILKQAGVTRISINPQTFNQDTLDLIGRRHTVEDVKEKWALAREEGFDNINMDLILGLPGERMPEVTHSLVEAVKLHPESLTVHSLAVKRTARLNLEKENWTNVYRAGNDMETMQQMMAASAYAAQQLALAPYYLYRQKNMAGNLENVGYAAEDKACLYNILMMEEKHSVAGCGAGCATKLVLPAQNRVERHENVKSLRDYLTRTDELLAKKRSFFANTL